MKRFKHILCVLHSRRSADTTLERAVSLAQNNQAALTVVSVAPRVTAGIGMPDGGAISAELQEAEIADSRQQHEQGLDDILSDVIKTQGSDAVRFLNPRKHMIKGQARKEVPSPADNVAADLVVMGTVSRTGVAGLFTGNTAEAILEQFECLVLAVKPAGFVTPVTLD